MVNLHDKARRAHISAAVVAVLYGAVIFVVAIWLFFVGFGDIAIIVAFFGFISCAIVHWIVDSIATIFKSHAVMHDKLDKLSEINNKENI